MLTRADLGKVTARNIFKKAAREIARICPDPNRAALVLAALGQESGFYSKTTQLGDIARALRPGHGE